MKRRRFACFALAFSFFGPAPALAQPSAAIVLSGAGQSVDKGDYRGALQQLSSIADGAILTGTLRRRFLTVRAESLSGDGYYDMAAAAAREAVDGFDLSKPDRADGLLLVARIEMLRGEKAAAALEQAMAAAIEADGPGGLRTLKSRTGSLCCCRHPDPPKPRR